MGWARLVFFFSRVSVPMSLGMAVLVFGGTPPVAAQTGTQSRDDGATPRPATVTVAPFANITGDPTIDWLGVGIAETVAVDLERFDGLAIVGRASLAAGPDGRRPDDDPTQEMASRLVADRH